LPPRLVLLERIVFASFLAFFLVLPFFPISMVMLGNYSILSTISWPSLVAMLYMSAFCVAAYHQCAACFLTSKQTGMFWIRVNNLLFTFGGFWIPLHTIKQYSTVLSMLCYLNPILYVTEGIRFAIFGTATFIPVYQCIMMLFGFSLLFVLLSWYLFKKRVDHL